MAFHFEQGDRPLEGYTIQRGVGRGGFGEVYYATSDGGKEVALKYLRENPQIELRGVSHCLNLKSPHLVAIHDVRQSEAGDHFVVMEYVSGPSLRDMMNAEPSGLGAQKAAYFLREMGKGLAYLHDRGIVHRDLKPGNIFYEDGYVKIGDYGLAKMMAASQHSGQTVSVGTVHYMAPEVGSGVYDRTIDIYALGVILYEMLLGRVPFSGSTMGEVLMKHLTAQPQVDALPQPFPQVIRKALAKDPKDRYQSVQEMLAEIFSVEALHQSVAAFEPASISTVAAHAARELNLKGPGAGGPPVGVAALGTGSSNVGGIGDDADFAGVKVEFGFPRNRIERMHGRIAARVDRMAQRIDHSKLGRQVAQAVTHPDHSGSKMLIALLVAAGMSFGVSLLAGDGANRPLFAALVFLHIASIVQGVLFGTWLCYDHLKIAGVVVPRLMIAAIGCAGLMGSSVLADLFNESVGGRPTEWVRALTLSMIFCDWAGRFYEGRKGNVSLGSAFSVALFAFVSGFIFTDGPALTLAAIAAAASLVVQSVGSLWPLPIGAPVPKTRHDEEPEPDAGLPAGAEGSPGFDRPHIERSDFGRRPARMAGQSPPPIPVHVSQAEADVDVRVRRSSAIRALWLLLSAISLCAMVMLYSAPHLMEDHVFDSDADKEIGVFTILGTLVACLFLFSFSRSLGSYKSGFWRGILRPAIFFGGVAMSAGSGIAMGMLDPKDEEIMLALGGILLGGAVSLFVWFVPVSPYRPPLPPTPEEVKALRVKKFKRVAMAGWIVLVLGAVQIIILLANLSSNEIEEVVPPLAVVILTLSLSMIVAGYVKARRAAGPPEPKPAKLALPLRQVFEIDGNPNLSRLIERHLTMFGYKLVQKSDLLWSFERGTWSAQFWQSDVRHWKTKFNVAAFELDTGCLRITCYVDMDASFNDPDQDQLAALRTELNDLKDLLSGREVPSNPPPSPA